MEENKINSVKAFMELVCVDCYNNNEFEPLCGIQRTILENETVNKLECSSKIKILERWGNGCDK